MSTTSTLVYVSAGCSVSSVSRLAAAGKARIGVDAGGAASVGAAVVRVVGAFVFITADNISSSSGRVKTRGTTCNNVSSS